MSLDSCEILALPQSELMDIVRRGCRSAQPSASAQARVTVNRLRPRHELPPLDRTKFRASNDASVRRSLAQRAVLASAGRGGVGKAQPSLTPSSSAGMVLDAAPPRKLR